MKILIIMVIGFVMGLLAYQVNNKMTLSLKNRFVYKAKLERFRALQEISQVVLTAWDIGASTTTTGCPPGTRQYSVQSQRLCWPQSRDSVCIEMQKDLFICPNLSGGRPSAFNWKEYLDKYIKKINPFEKSYAATGNVFTLMNPRGSSAPGGSVRVRVPSCSGGANDYCLSCNVGTTDCLTLSFCIGDSRSTSCSNNDKVIQTFAVSR